MTFCVETATAEDIPSWLGLAAEVGDLFGTDMANDPKFHEALNRNVARASAFCIRIDREVAGAMLLGAATINWIAVRKRFRRQGIARALVAHALSARHPQVHVTTFGPGHPHPDADGARALYRAMEFTTVHEAPQPGPDGTPRESMVWTAS